MSSSILDNQITSRNYETFRKDCLTLIGDIRHTETELRRIYETALDLGITTKPAENATDIQILSTLASLACERGFDLKKTEALDDTKRQASEITNRSHRTTLGRLLNKAASLAG